MFGEPAEGQLLGSSARCAMQIGPGVIARAEDEINLLLFNIGLLAVEAELPATLEDVPAAFDHGEIAGGRLVVTGLGGEGLGTHGIEGAAHSFF
jgi:hypothetical protein